MIARLGEEAVSLNVPMIVDLKFGRTWGEASRKVSPSWEALSSMPALAKPAPRPAIKTATIVPIKKVKPAPKAPVKKAKPAVPPPATPTVSATVIPIKPAIVVPRQPTIVKPSRPAIAIPIHYTSAPTPPLTAPPAQAAAPPDDSAIETEIDLADLIDVPVPRNRKICCPFHGETKPSMHIYVDHYFCYGCGRWGDHVKLADPG